MVDSVWQWDTFVFVMWKLFEYRKVFVALLFPDLPSHERNGKHHSLGAVVDVSSV